MAPLEPVPAGDAWEQRRILVSLRIERAGLALMCEHGPDDVTVEQISREADISVRTFFRYFRNPSDILTAVPARESRRMCDALLARPPGESLLDGFHAWFREIDHGRDPSTPTGALEAETVLLWSAVVREAPELIQSESRALIVLSADLREVVRHRLGFGVADEEQVGVLSAALAAVIWYVYARSLENDPTELMTRLDRAFDLLELLHSGAPV